MSKTEKLKDMLEQKVNLLPEYEKKVIVLMFGLEDGQKRSEEEVAMILGIKVSVVKRVLASGLRRLRRLD